jgi:hypothetical protein
MLKDVAEPAAAPAAPKSADQKISERGEGAVSHWRAIVFGIIGAIGFCDGAAHSISFFWDNIGVSGWRVAETGSGAAVTVVAYLFARHGHKAFKDNPKPKKAKAKS